MCVFPVISQGTTLPNDPLASTSLHLGYEWAAGNLGLQPIPDSPPTKATPLEHVYINGKFLRLAFPNRTVVVEGLLHAPTGAVLQGGYDRMLVAGPNLQVQMARYVGVCGCKCGLGWV